MWRRVRLELFRVGNVTLWLLAAAILNFVAGVIIARSLGPAGRGLVSVLVSFGAIVTIAAAAGTNVAFRALLPKSDVVNFKGYIKATFILTGFAGVPLFLGAALFIGLAIDESALRPLGICLFLFFGLTNLVWLQAKEGMNAVGLIGSGAFLGALGSVFFLVAVIGMSMVWPGADLAMLLAYSLMNIFQIFLAVFSLRKYLGAEAAAGTRVILRAGPPYLAYHFGQEMALRFDRTLIGALSSSAAAGMFSVSAGIAEMLRLPVLASGQFVLLDSATGGMTIKTIIRRAGFWMALSMCGAGAIWPMGPFLINVLYGSAFAGAVAPLRLLLVGQVMLVPFLIVSRALIGLGGRWLASAPSLVGVIVLVIMGIFWIPSLGAIGGALACITAFMAMSFVSWVCVELLVRNSVST